MDLQPIARFESLLQKACELGASDLHLSSGEAPSFRVHGSIRRVGEAPLGPADVHAMALEILEDGRREAFDHAHTVDLAYSIATLPEAGPRSRERFRINVYRERGRTAIAVRRLESRFRSLEELRLPPGIGDLATLPDGLVLVTGPTGSGKTTTLATLVHRINLERPCHILTIEDPIEYLHEPARALVHQRELLTDVPSFADAVRAALREDPNVLLVGEMRDKETMRAAIQAAETGHLVFSTLHTGSAVGSIDRIVGAFDAGEQESIRSQLSMVLKAVVTQRLLPTADGQGRVPAVEVLVVTTAVANLIRTARAEQICATMEAGAAQGMRTFDQSLAHLVQANLVRPEEAKRYARDPAAFEASLAARRTGQAAAPPAARADRGAGGWR